MAEATNELTVGVEVKTGLKAGVKTSEFWLVLLSILGVLVPVIGGLATAHPELSAGMSVLAAALVSVYTIGRQVLKAEALRQTNIIPDEWEPTLNEFVDAAGKLAEAMKPLSPALIGPAAPAGSPPPAPIAQEPRQ